jgi:hypothetical protein
MFRETDGNRWSADVSTGPDSYNSSVASCSGDYIEEREYR